jgi:hypothetical protein
MNPERTSQNANVVSVAMPSWRTLYKKSSLSESTITERYSKRVEIESVKPQPRLVSRSEVTSNAMPNPPKYVHAGAETLWLSLTTPLTPKIGLDPDILAGHSAPG